MLFNDNNDNSTFYLLLYVNVITIILWLIMNRLFGIDPDHYFDEYSYSQEEVGEPCPYFLPDSYWPPCFVEYIALKGLSDSLLEFSKEFNV